MLDLINRVYVATWARMQREEGQTMVEYGLILALVSIAAVAILGTMSGSVQGVFQSIIDQLPGAGS